MLEVEHFFCPAEARGNLVHYEYRISVIARLLYFLKKILRGYEDAQIAQYRLGNKCGYVSFLDCPDRIVFCALPLRTQANCLRIRPELVFMCADQTKARERLTVISAVESYELLSPVIRYGSLQRKLDRFCSSRGS